MQHNVVNVLVLLGAVHFNGLAGSPDAKINLGAKINVGAKISPELEPKSDKKFFDKDYVDDTRPVVQNHFGHPYPEIQDSQRYDRDYVQDKNDDGGEWKTQMAYDEVKNRLAKEKAEAQKALEKESEERHELKKAENEEKKAEEVANAAAKKENNAENDRQVADKAHDKVKDDLDEATVGVENEVKELEDCKRQLAEAKAKLKALLAEKEAADKNAAESKVTEKKADFSLDELKAAMEASKAEWDAARGDAEKERAEVEAAENRLLVVAEKLRLHRKADPDGGVYSVQKAGACGKSPLVVLFLALSTAWLL